MSARLQIRLASAVINDNTPSGGALLGHFTDWRSLSAWSLRENAAVVILTVLYVAIAIALLAARGLPLPRYGSILVNAILFGSAAVAIAGPAILVGLALRRPDSPMRWIVEKCADIRLAERVAIAAPALIALIFFLPTFSAMKSAVPAFQPYVYDPLLIEIDFRLHGGDPWRLLQPLIGWPFVSFLLNGIYHLWILLLYIGVLAVTGWLERPDLRRQFLITYLLAWPLLGNLAATWLSSVGPCFYEFFYGDDRFAPQMAYLRQANEIWPLMVLDVQDRLLEWHRVGSSDLGRGISAMPSMHVSIACLFAILGWRISRFWGVVGSLFLIAILIGSVHLAYHYAIDGYASILATLLIWWIVGRTMAGRKKSLPGP